MDKVSNSIYRKLVIKIVFFSSFITILSTFVQLYSDYLSDINRIENIQHDVLSSYSESLKWALWGLDSLSIESQIKGMSNINNINSIRIITTDGKTWEKGEHKKNNVIEKIIELKHVYSDNKELILGNIIIQSDLFSVYQRLLNKALVILISNGVKTFLVAGFILLLIRKIVTNPLSIISTFLKQTDPLEKKKLILKTPHDRKSNGFDEIDQVVESINVMNLEIHNSYGEIVTSKENLKCAFDEINQLLVLKSEFTNVLENTVRERTKELENLLDELHRTQNFLIEKEKLASLGGLVAGLCHEINTPLGICVTAVSTLNENNESMRYKFDSGKITKESLASYIKSIDDFDMIVSKNLEKSVELMGHFRQVSVDQTSYRRRKFSLDVLLEETTVILSPLYKNKHLLSISCPPDIIMDSYPGPLGQVITNFVNNSIIHAFQDSKDDGVMSLVVKEIKSERVTIIFTDNGKGIPESDLKKIFDPFYTTSLSGKGSGLGLNISFNIVVGILGGSLSVNKNSDSGCSFVVDMPRSAPINEIQ